MNIGNQRIENTIIQMLSDLKLGFHYFGEFLLYVNFSKLDTIPTAGVNVSRQGMNFYYNEKFINKLTNKELAFLVLHELLHLHHKHMFRGKLYDHKLANEAQDMIINTIIIEDVPKSFADLEGNLTPLFIPKKYKGKMIFEELYDWLKDNPEERPEGSGGEAKGDVIDEHMENEDCVTEEFAEAVIKDIVEGLKARGISTGNAETLLNKVEKPKKDYLKEIKKYSAQIKGFFKHKTYSRLSRKGIQGVKGYKKLGTEIACLLDTSGSMMGEFEKILSVINQNNIISNVVLVDTNVKDTVKVKNKRDVQNIKIKGLGGTELMPGIKYYLENKELNKLPLLILTDGYCDSLNLKGVKSKTLIISVGTKVEILNPGRGVKQIHLD